jgi:type II secretory pathway component PulF
MPVYAYRAQDAGRLAVRGEIAADSPRRARELLRRRGWLVQRIAVQRPNGARSLSLRVPRLGPRRRRSPSKVLSFVRELSTLLSVGVPLVEALQTLARQHRRGRFHAVLLELADRVSGGSGLASAMAQHPELFDELAVTITQVGEDAGTLEQSLERLALFQERAAQLRGRLATALIYPVIVSVMALAISAFLMTAVVPSILEPLVELGRPLPLPTRIVKSASDGVVTWGWAGALVLLVTTALAAWAVQTRRGRRLRDAALLRVPLLGELARKQAVVRIAVVTGVLLRSGVVFVRAVQVAQRAARNVILAEALQRCEAAVGAGSDIGEALERTGAFPPLVVQVFAVGQQSGRLEEMLERLANGYDAEVATAAQRLTAVLEPVLIVALALLVLLIAMATMLPILEASNVIG